MNLESGFAVGDVKFLRWHHDCSLLSVMPYSSVVTYQRCFGTAYLSLNVEAVCYSKRWCQRSQSYIPELSDSIFAAVIC